MFYNNNNNKIINNNNHNNDNDNNHNDNNNNDNVSFRTNYEWFTLFCLFTKCNMYKKIEIPCQNNNNLTNICS